MSFVIIGNTIYFSKSNIYTLLEYLSLSLELEGMDEYPQASIVLKGKGYTVFCSGDAEVGIQLIQKYFMGIPFKVVKYSDKVFTGDIKNLTINYLPIQDAYYESHVLEIKEIP